MRPWLRRLHLGPREQTNAPLGDWAMSGVLASLALSVLLVVSMLTLGVDAMAGPEWCEDDPVFLVNGALVDVTTSFPAEYLDSVREVEFELEVPSNVTAAVVSLPSKVPTTATITYSLPPYWAIGSVPVVVNVTVKASGSFETSTRVTGTYASSRDEGLLGLGGSSDLDVGVSSAPGKSNVRTQVGYSLIGL